MLRFLHPPDATLSPPLALRDSTQILREIIAVYDTSLVDESDRANDEDFAKLLEKAVDPAVEMCERMADMRKGNGGDWERDIFLINCLGYLQVCLARRFCPKKANDSSIRLRCTHSRNHGSNFSRLRSNDTSSR